MYLNDIAQVYGPNTTTSGGRNVSKYCILSVNFPNFSQFYKIDEYIDCIG